MKGVVFTEFMDMVEEVFSLDTLDLIIDKSDLPNDGAYTAVGTYDHEEIVRMVVNLSDEVDMPVPALLEAFGSHLFGRFTQLYPHFFDQISDPFEFLKHVDNYIHVEVEKLYPEAELPRFSHVQNSDKLLTMYYQSSRHFEDLAVGLIKGCLSHFGAQGEVTKSESEYQGEPAIEIRINLQ